MAIDDKSDTELNAGGTKSIHNLTGVPGDRILAVQKHQASGVSSPGRKILVQARRLPRKGSSFDSLLLSAIDVATHLQLARIYFVSSLAATIDFFEYLGRAYPFAVKEIVTRINPESDTSRVEDEHRLALAAQRCGFRYRDIEMNDGDGLRDLEQYFFPDTADHGEDQRPAQLAQFLFFHNNDRPLPTLCGRTPIQSLRNFPAFRRLVVFDPQ
ncbi:MAG TPA: hypothetical protein VGA55_08055 [Bacteroidota bacterium]